MSDAPHVCVSCRKPLGSYFAILRYDGANTEPRSTVVVCSLMCCIKWAYETATLSGMKLAFGAKNTISALLNSLRGSK